MDCSFAVQLLVFWILEDFLGFFQIFEDFGIF